ncbi:PglL family O-oligosaccharyltransferase [Noviherbaspirillum massiliense]|uniref:PglL family O-oligosaccharyltransferase n=1 Tax=Noviherbaspirillum massiliense TaxID=1465823 RepID=UPI001652A588|nr:O-antigen ligase family protein [Noviherbaspirillum massiliense]
MDAAQTKRSLVLLWLSIVFAYLLPYHVYPFNAFYNDWLVIFGISIALLGVATEIKPRIQLPWIALVPAGLTVPIILQVLGGMMQFSSDAILPVAYLLIATIAIVLGAGITANKQLGSIHLCKILAFAHLLAGAVSLVIACCQFLGVEYLPFMMGMPRRLGTRPYANVGQPNQLALLFCISIASAWWLYQAGKLSKSVAFGIVLLLMVGLVLTQSRIGWLIMPIFAWFTWSWRNREGYKNIPAKVLTALVACYVVLIIVLPTIAAALGVSAASAAERVGTHSERIALIQQALEVSFSHPWFGAGWYEFGPQQIMIGADFEPSIYVQHAHNIVLNFAAELGWPVTILIFGALAYWFYFGCLRRASSKEVGFATLFFMAVLVHSMVEFPLWYAYVLLPMALLMGMVHQEQFGSKMIQVPRTYIVALYCVMSMGLITVAMDYRRVVVDFRAMGWERLGLKADEGTTDKPNFTLFPYFYDYFRFAKMKPREGMSPEDISFMEHVAKRFGYAPVMMRMSLVYGSNDRQEEAIRSMLTINRLHPNDYLAAYRVWQSMAVASPARYMALFERLPKPNSPNSLK